MRFSKLTLFFSFWLLVLVGSAPADNAFGNITVTKINGQTIVTGSGTLNLGTYTLTVPAAGFEPGLGNPSVNGYVLSSTTSGVRSWIANGSGGGGSGTVTSVALTAPGIFSVAGSPVTTSGTLALSLATQTANTVWAGPTTGGAATPAFRALVAADIPSLSGTYQPLSTVLTNLAGNTGTVSLSGVTLTLPAAFVTLTGTQTLTNKTITSPLGIVKGDVGLGNVDNTSDATKNAASATLTNKTISGASNTLSNIGNASLTNSAITIAGASTSLGGSLSASAILDSISGTQGTLLYRGATGWAVLAPGTTGFALVTNGAAADPEWSDRYMVVSTYDPQGHSKITGANAGGGTLNLDGGGMGGAGGDVSTHGGTGAGGSVLTYGDAAAGGSLDTHDGGGSLDTRGTGSLELGIAATRTTLVGAATAARTITLPDSTGTVALMSNIPSAAPSFSSLTDGGTITLTCDASKVSQNATVTLGGNRTLAIASPADGMTGVLIVKQDGTGTRTLTLPAGSQVIAGGSGAVILSTAANAIDILTWIYDGTNYFWTIGNNYN